MGDLISRSALIKEFTEANKKCNYDLWHFTGIKAFIENIPTVNAVPVVHGEWIDIQPDYHSGFYGNVHKCSNCGDYYTTE